MEISNSLASMSQSNVSIPSERRTSMKLPSAMAIMRSAEVIKRNSVTFGLVNAPEDSQSYIDYLLANAKNNSMKKKLQDIKDILINVDFNVNKPENLKILSEILKKAPNYRASHDLLVVEKAFNSKISKESMKAIYKKITYKKLEKHEKLFDYGDEGDNFYIIIKGKVFIMIPRAVDAENTPKEHSTSQTPKFSLMRNMGMYNSPSSTKFENYINDSGFKSRFSHAMLQKQRVFPNDLLSSMTNDDVNYFMENYSNFQVIKQLTSEETFGEIALRETVKRTATIVANEETYLAVLSKEDFRAILSFIALIQNLIMMVYGKQTLIS